LNAEAAKRVLITDGAFGTEIQNWKLSEADYAGALGLPRDQKGNNDILAISRPEVPETITRAYLEAGSDIVSTNTFSANRISQADYGAEALVADINVESARIARRLADEYQAKDGRASSPARSGRPTRRSPSRPTSTIRAIARSTSTP
jgi:5-methyltetrahydrofolate--homocysteine methyltransferase